MIRVILDVDIIFSLKEQFSPKLFNGFSAYTKLSSRRSILHLLYQCRAALFSRPKML
jgi:hypothetical protein